MVKVVSLLRASLLTKQQKTQGSMQNAMFGVFLKHRYTNAYISQRTKVIYIRTRMAKRNIKEREYTMYYVDIIYLHNTFPSNLR